MDHGILLKKLEHYGVSGKYLSWIRNFLTGRVQTVSVNNHLSYPTPVVSGVPQGSVLATSMFMIYVNDLSSVVSNSNSSVLTFADDTKIISKISNVKDKNNLQEDLNNIIKWSDANNMVLNNNKFELVNFRLNNENQNQKILINSLPFNESFFTYEASNGIEIHPSANVRDLGIIMDRKLNFDAQINNIASRAKQTSAWILSVFYTRDQHTMLFLFNSLVRPKLEYCDAIWNPYQIKHINKIEGVQRFFTSRISGMRDIGYWERLNCLNLMSLQRRRERNIIILLWKIKNKTIPNCFNIEFKENQRAVAIKAIIKPLSKIKGRVLTVYDASFPIISAKLWNTLPGKLTVINSLNAFKIGLDKFLKTIPDEPPLPGYPFQSNNSLISLHLKH